MKKTELEIALDKYYKKFGNPYPLGITSGLSDEEVIDDINQCIESEKEAPEPEYEEDNLY